MDQILTSQIMTDVLQREQTYEDQRFIFRIQCTGTETEPYMAKETVKYRFQITKVDFRQGNEKIYELARRYSHFEWLQNELQTKVLGRIIPSLPERTQNYDKDKRKLEFVFFMQKILDHKKLQFIDCYEKFFSEELCDFNAFQEYYEKMTESNSLFYKIKNTGVNVVNFFSKFLNTNSAQIIQRLPDDHDREFEEYKKELETNKAATELIFQDMSKIVNKLKQQCISLLQSQNIFSIIPNNLVNECQGTESFGKLKSLTKIYESTEIQLRQKYLYRLETCIRDYDQGLKVIIMHKELKDLINQETQLINNPAYKGQLEELRLSISNNQQKVKQLYSNFTDDVQIFKQHQQNYLTEIQTNFNSELQQFYDSIRSLKKL